MVSWNAFGCVIISGGFCFLARGCIATGWESADIASRYMLCDEWIQDDYIGIQSIECTNLTATNESVVMQTMVAFATQGDPVLEPATKVSRTNKTLKYKLNLTSPTCSTSIASLSHTVSLRSFLRKVCRTIPEVGELHCMKAQISAPVTIQNFFSPLGKNISSCSSTSTLSTQVLASLLQLTLTKHGCPSCSPSSSLLFGPIGQSSCWRSSCAPRLDRQSCWCCRSGESAGCCLWSIPTEPWYEDH
jgi:hypothetical protein